MERLLAFCLDLAGVMVGALLCLFGAKVFFGFYIGGNPHGKVAFLAVSAMVVIAWMALRAICSRIVCEDAA